MIGADIAVRQPVHAALSGPAAGVMATLQIAENTGVANSISFDTVSYTHLTLPTNREV